MIHFPRESGILLHISSLPGSYGIGELGSEAIRFVSCLKKDFKNEMFDFFIF